jgi:pilus assembly protein Flp/PilA
MPMNNTDGPFGYHNYFLASLYSQTDPQRENEMDCKPETLHRDDVGASMVEYALLVILIAIVAILGVQIAGQEVSNAFSTVAGGLATPN